MKITAHVGYGHPNGQRIRAGLTFEVAPADYEVTAEQYAAIAADDEIIVTKAHGRAKAVEVLDTQEAALKVKTPSQMNVEELKALAAERGVNVSGAKTKKDMRALIAHGPVKRASQASTAAEQQERDK